MSAAAVNFPSGNLPMRDQFKNTHGTMHLRSACGNVCVGLHPQHAESYHRAPIGAWWASETRRDSNGQEWIKHAPATYFVVNDFGHLVEITRP